MLLCYLFQKAPTKGFQDSVLQKFKGLKLHHFLPSFTKVWNCSRKMKLILISHFFGSGFIVMLSVYTTSWVGQNVLRGDPEAPFMTKGNKLFETGVAWGSLALMFTSFVILIMSFILHKMVNNPKKENFKMLHVFAQLLATLAILICLYCGNLNSTFLVIPLTGVAFQTFHTVPEILAELLETEESIATSGTYRRLLDFSFFYAQVLMFLVVPLIFIFFPDRDDNQWGMLVSAFSGLASVLFASFI